MFVKKSKKKKKEVEIEIDKTKDTKRINVKKLKDFV